MTGRIASFMDLGKALGREIPENRKGKKMNNVTQKPLPEFKAVTKYYNHNKRYGFVFVHIPADTMLEFNVTTSERDDSPGQRYQAGEATDRELVIEAFIHGSVIERSGFDRGLEPDQELSVKITQNEKGIQVVWTPNKDGTRPPNSNAPRIANAFLRFVPAIVKIYHPDRNFGFVRISHNSETGEPLKSADGKPMEIEAHFTSVTLDRARYAMVKPDMEVQVKYFQREDGRYSVSQFRYPDVETTDADCIKPREESTGQAA